MGRWLRAPADGIREPSEGASRRLRRRAELDGKIFVTRGPRFCPPLEKRDPGIDGRDSVPAVPKRADCADRGASVASNAAF